MLSASKGETIGFCNIETVVRAPRVEYHFIGLYVAAPHLDWTCGAMLLSHAIEYCRNNGIQALLAFTKHTNVPAIRLIEHFDFERSGKFSDINYDGADSISYCKTI